jgi:hypothetical protein
VRLEEQFAKGVPMEDNSFLELWVPIESDLREIEEHYRSQRLRPNSQPYPEGIAKVKLFRNLGRACELYIIASPEQREIMRALFAWSYVLPPYLLRLINLPCEGKSTEQSFHALRLALAAASLENNKTDYRDTYLALGAVYVNAVCLGINPVLFFEEAASWSSSQDDFGYRIAPMRDFLSHFKDSAFFKTDVQPRLSKS